MKFKFFSDAGHAWLKVPFKLLIDLKINTQISKFSYRRGDFAYLEEDCDATIFVNALKAKGIPFEYTEHISDKSSKIRSYEPYKLFDYDISSGKKTCMICPSIKCIFAGHDEDECVGCDEFFGE